MALRRAVFCTEQGLFGADDRDAVDAHARLLVAIAEMGGMPDQVVGTVRIHEQTPGTWYGSRLAVLRSQRRHAHLGSGLIELAVRSAHSSGARVFLAHVQSQNVPLFERLHWQSLEQVSLHGRPHHFMRADLAHYPPLEHPEAGLMILNRAVA
jgi:putative N-acetyltransferase (TIGR04045 family)